MIYIVTRCIFYGNKSLIWKLYLIIIARPMNNTPTLMQSEEHSAPWNAETKEVTVSVTISQTFEVDKDTDLDLLEKEITEDLELNDWDIDDFEVI